MMHGQKNIKSLLQFCFVLLKQWFSDTCIKGACSEIYGFCT